MRLPEVAKRLRELAMQLDCDELNGFADEIGRRPSGQRATRTSLPMTDLLRDQIRAMKEADPSLEVDPIDGTICAGLLVGSAAAPTS